MDDRELLELAAKAVGIKQSVVLLPCDGVSIIEDVTGRAWNPLTKVADMVEMNAVLRINTDWGADGMVCCISEIPDDPPWFNEKHNGTTEGKLKAWMRASTRAAAEIGRGM